MEGSTSVGTIVADALRRNDWGLRDDFCAADRFGNLLAECYYESRETGLRVRETPAFVPRSTIDQAQWDVG